MSRLIAFLVYWFILIISIYHALGNENKPFLELYEPDANNLGKHCLINDVGVFTVRGKVNKNGSNSKAYKDTNLYMQAVKDPSTKAWATQCRPNLTICEKDLNTGCYCESKDENGDYHLVMNIMAKSIYSNGSLMLSWNDAISPYNTPITSNQVHYYPGPICEPIKVTLKTGTTDTILNIASCPHASGDLHLHYKPEMTNLTFCVHNLATIGSVQIQDTENKLNETKTDPCISIPLNQIQSRDLNLTFTESGGCERTGLYTLRLEPVTARSGFRHEDYDMAYIVVSCIMTIFGVLSYS